MKLPAVNMGVNKAIFLDKDGTLIRDIPYNVNPDLITLTEGTLEGLKMLCAAGYQLIVISNQSGVAMGFFDYDELFLVERKIAELLCASGIEIKAFYYCPHHPQAVVEQYKKRCKCRKPGAGMFRAAAEAHSIELSASWMIGDILDDIEAGNRAGCKTVLINNGNETEWVINKNRVPDCMVGDINAAANYILDIPALGRAIA